MWMLPYKKNLANEEYISMAKMEFLYFQNEDVEYSISQTKDKWNEIHEEIVHANIIRMKMELWGQLWLYWENKLILVAYTAEIHHTKDVLHNTVTTLFLDLI